ncbi:CHY zinc finger protein [Bacillus sp. 2205SS5-2]|uniref:CHY zinc finger protein n=1 Tax=Bacillus sp. 2205SS5-2 TaxID=3109031 RepID=UPI00300569A1
MNSNVTVKGIEMDEQTRCCHYSSELDIIALKFKCCQTYFPCYQCHEELTGHVPILWGKQEKQTKAILCGSCWNELTIEAYQSCQERCPNCRARFNPGCANHYHLYFD